MLSKRRAQLKQVIKECVEKAMVFLDKEADVDKRLELLDTLRSVTEGKIFVEMERARRYGLIERLNGAIDESSKRARNWRVRARERAAAATPGRAAERGQSSELMISSAIVTVITIFKVIQKD